jgi:hypothetical protein
MQASDITLFLHETAFKWAEFFGTKRGFTILVPYEMYQTLVDASVARKPVDTVVTRDREVRAGVTSVSITPTTEMKPPRDGIPEVCFTFEGLVTVEVKPLPQNKLPEVQNLRVR